MGKQLSDLGQEIWDRIEYRIREAPRGGMAADGHYSGGIDAQQRAFVKGLRAARLSILTMVEGDGRRGDLG